MRLMNMKGDEVLVEEASVEVAQAKLTEFLDDCVKRYGKEPPVWYSKSGKEDGYEELKNPRSLPADEMEKLGTQKILCQFPLVGG